MYKYKQLLNDLRSLIDSWETDQEKQAAMKVSQREVNIIRGIYQQCIEELKKKVEEYEQE